MNTAIALSTIEIVILAIAVLAFPIVKYYLIERGRVSVYMSNFIHQPEDSVRTGSHNQLFGNTKFHAIICVKNIGKTPVKDLRYNIIESESTLSKCNKNALKQTYPVKNLEPNIEEMIHIFDPRTSEEMVDIVMGDKDRAESIRIEIKYKDIFGIPHTHKERLPFYKVLYPRKTELEKISSWLRNIRDEMRGLARNLQLVAREIKDSKENQED